MTRKPPIFVLAAPRSFSSISASILGGHPEAYSVPELNILNKEHMKEFMEEFRDIFLLQTHGILRTISELYAGEQTMETIAMSQRWLIKRAERKTSDIYQEICDRIYPLTLIDKSPGYTLLPQRLARIKKYFPDAYYLHLTRHPIDMNKSMCKLERGKLLAALSNSIDSSKENEIIDPQLMWYTCNANILEFLKYIKKENKLTIKGEEIMNNREEALKKICSWMNWKWSSCVYEQMIHPEKSHYAQFGPVGAELGSDPNYLRSPRLRQNNIIISSLEDNLDWVEKGRKLYPHIKKMALDFGYT